MLVYSIEIGVNAYLRAFPEEADRLQPLLQQLETDKGSILQRSNMSGHITGSMFVLGQDFKSALLIHHRQLDKWLQPGGHHEGNLSIRATALRELLEETGIASIEFLSVRGSPHIPLDIDTHAIPARPSKNEGAHRHHDFTYLARCTSDSSVEVQDEEILAARWVPLLEILTFDNPRMRTLAEKALKLVPQAKVVDEQGLTKPILY